MIFNTNKNALLILLIFNALLSQVGINTNKPDASAILDLGPGDKALIHNRVALTAVDDISTVATPINGLLVYNTNDVVSDTIFSNALYYYDANPSVKKWKNIVSDDSLDKYLNTKKVPIFVGELYKLNSQVLNERTGNLNIVKWGTSAAETKTFFNQDVIERLPNSTTTFKVLKTGIFSFEGFVNWKFTNTGTTYWTVAVQSGISDDSNISNPTNLDFGMRCPYYSWESSAGFYKSCSFVGALRLEAGTIFRLVTVKKNLQSPSYAIIGGESNYAAGMKIVFFPE